MNENKRREGGRLNLFDGSFSPLGSRGARNAYALRAPSYAQAVQAIACRVSFATTSGHPNKQYFEAIPVASSGAIRAADLICLRELALCGRRGLIWRAPDAGPLILFYGLHTYALIMQMTIYRSAAARAPGTPPAPAAPAGPAADRPVTSLRRFVISNESLCPF
ncbi:hypothetical protein EVAR_68173_1 [Eumeta japonica]|uniref:Uncharacterized protein n=1 Tax=Eumeta variegata TaxID=151549 RepID=A0A4C2A2A1_EUMVA|nr:hypothetical protein EVAR_68173_1 [Eumeta japonica]